MNCIAPLLERNGLSYGAIPARTILKVGPGPPSIQRSLRWCDEFIIHNSKFIIHVCSLSRTVVSVVLQSAATRKRNGRRSRDEVWRVVMIEIIEHGNVRELRLARPPANALSPELLVELSSQVASAPADGVGALVLSGAEGLFTGGLDVPLLLALDHEEMMAALELSSAPWKRWPVSEDPGGRGDHRPQSGGRRGARALLRLEGDGGWAVSHRSQRGADRDPHAGGRRRSPGPGRRSAARRERCARPAA